MAAAPPSQKRKDSPVEPLKRAITMTCRAITADHELQVGFGPGQPDIAGHTMHLPEPSRAPKAREIAVLRGLADGLSLRAACHDTKLHAKLAPAGGQARAVYDAIERARIEAIGANRMAGMAKNLSARIEDHYGQARFAHIQTRADAPLEDAVSLIVRERLTGAAPPATAETVVGFWRSSVEGRIGQTLAKLPALTENQEAFGRLARDILRSLDLVTEEEFQGQDSDEETSEDQEQAEGGDAETEPGEQLSGFTVARRAIEARNEVLQGLSERLIKIISQIRAADDKYLELVHIKKTRLG